MQCWAADTVAGAIVGDEAAIGDAVDAWQWSNLTGLDLAQCDTDFYAAKIACHAWWYNGTIGSEYLAFLQRNIDDTALRRSGGVTCQALSWAYDSSSLAAFEGDASETEVERQGQSCLFDNVTKLERELDNFDQVVWLNDDGTEVTDNEPCWDAPDAAPGTPRGRRGDPPANVAVGAVVACDWEGGNVRGDDEYVRILRITIKTVAGPPVEPLYCDDAVSELGANATSCGLVDDSYVGPCGFAGDDISDAGGCCVDLTQDPPVCTAAGELGCGEGHRFCLDPALE
ncbi:hypothetical protein M885DRAFT_299136 [Pelagophyceae sp. CCMP2097]|nr:hypothetical protein M885DRAFT_299136 [Pelagophyceae sp. CCMP2097]